MPTTATATPYPLIPMLPPQAADETPRDYGLRAFRFLLAEGLTAALLDDGTLDQAFGASLHLLPGLGDAALPRIVEVRRDIAATLDRRRREARAAERAALAAAAAPKTDGGKPAPLRRPVPVVPPAATARRL